MKSLLAILFISSILFCSCNSRFEIIKKKYNKGFYANIFSNKHKIREKKYCENEIKPIASAKNNKIVEEIVLTENNDLLASNNKSELTNNLNSFTNILVPVFQSTNKDTIPKARLSRRKTYSLDENSNKIIHWTSLASFISGVICSALPYIIVSPLIILINFIPAALAMIFGYISYKKRSNSPERYYDINVFLGGIGFIIGLRYVLYKAIILTLVMLLFP